MPTMPPHAVASDQSLVRAEEPCCQRSHTSARVEFDLGHSKRFSDTFSSFVDAIRCRSSDVKTNTVKRVGKLSVKPHFNRRAKAAQEVDYLSKKTYSMRYKPCVVDEVVWRSVQKLDRVASDENQRAVAAENIQGKPANRTDIEVKDAGARQVIKEDPALVKHVPAVEQKARVDPKERMIALKECQWVVKQLSSERILDQRKAAMDVKRIAGVDSEARVTLAMLGAIPPLVGMLDSSSSSLQCLALQALLNLATSQNVNKSAIVGAGAINRMLKLLSTTNHTVREYVLALLLSLSALDANKLSIGMSGVIPVLINLLERENLQTRRDALRILYNLSICPGNIPAISDTKALDLLLEVLYETSLSEKALGILGNLAATERGRLSLMKNKEALPVLIDVLGWADASKCQERAVYVLMVLAHHSLSYRQALASMGAVSSLLELVLLGSSLSQKRAGRILESLRENKQDSRSSAVQDLLTKVQEEDCKLEPNYVVLSEERKAVNHMVQESLQKNMDRIFQRAHLPSTGICHSDHMSSPTSSRSFSSLCY